jgi:hypothetical protein
MSGSQKTVLAAIALIAFEVINSAILLALTGGAGLIPKIVRLIFTCVLSFFLIREATWARSLTGILCALGLAITVISLGSAVISGVVSLFSILGIWMVLMIAFYAWVAFTLLLDKDVAQHFNPRGGF